MKKDPYTRTSSARRRPEKRASLPGVAAWLIVLATAFGVVFVMQGSPDLWDLWHERAKYGARPTGCR